MQNILSVLHWNQEEKKCFQMLTWQAINNKTSANSKSAEVSVIGKNQ